MTSTRTDKPPSEPAFDLAYSLHDFSAGDGRDSEFLHRRLDEAMVREGSVRSGRVLDVACGAGKLLASIARPGVTAVGLDPSEEMLALTRASCDGKDVLLVRALGERLPFADETFDRLVCQGSLDHFVEPQAFIAEAARVLRAEGRLVIGLANYESLSCRLGRLRHAIGRRVFRNRPPTGERAYWEIPLDHFHKGEVRFVKSLGGRLLTLERCYGVSMLWLFRGWDRALERLPAGAARNVLGGLDKVAQRLPGQADMIISVWRKRL
jgi:SAM-dependent methyltransferase